jgi:hypothetical protein
VRQGGGILIDGVDVTKTFGRLIGAFDLDLISGLGSAVGTSYAEEMKKKAEISQK